MAKRGRINAAGFWNMQRRKEADEYCITGYISISKIIMVPVGCTVSFFSFYVAD